MFYYEDFQNQSWKSLSLNVQGSNPKKQIFGDEKIQKAYKNPKLAFKTKFLEWFGHKTSEPIGFHDNIVIIQRKLFFSKRNQFQTDLKAVWYTLMYFWHSEFILSSMGHNGTLAKH